LWKEEGIIINHFLTTTPAPGLQQMPERSIRLGLGNKFIHEEYKMSEAIYFNLYYLLQLPDMVSIVASFEENFDFAYGISSPEQWQHVCKLLPTWSWLLHNAAFGYYQQGTMLKGEDIEDATKPNQVLCGISKGIPLPDFRNVEELLGHPQVCSIRIQVVTLGAQVLAELIRATDTQHDSVWQQLKSSLAEGFVDGLRRGIKDAISDTVADYFRGLDIFSDSQLKQVALSGQPTSFRPPELFRMFDQARRES
jgi:hypothetical protein